MLPNRVRLSKRASDNLKALKTKTRIAPNILSRIAVGLSLRQPEKVDLSNLNSDGLELHVSALFGEYVLLYECLLREAHGQLSAKQAQQAISWHVERGVEKLRKMKNIGEVLGL